MFEPQDIDSARRRELIPEGLIPAADPCSFNIKLLLIGLKQPVPYLIINDAVI
ncbi:hypothetical protein [uncultured Shewanella sp.]|uniref:hypothetical protein n=1 Tax=uncultured Shewanella sp. TaxID=173975 RepID=UPI00261ACCEE|nr:hypothetical protein [uncultured Shewanella sp.]